MLVVLELGKGEKREVEAEGLVVGIGRAVVRELVDCLRGGEEGRG
jgi:hypothetical protein